jgi:V-type H+-transporting ATPase subunit a
MNSVPPFQAGDFFHSAQSRAIEQQREYDSRQLSGESMEAPLLQDQVDILPAHI